VNVIKDLEREVHNVVQKERIELEHPNTRHPSGARF